MGLKSETRMIEGLSVTVQQFPALHSLKLMTKLGSILAPVLSSLDGLSMDSDIQALAPALGELFMRLDHQDAVQLACELLQSSYAIVNDRKVELNDAGRVDLVFEGNLRGLLASLLFAIEINFGDFFGGAQAGSATENSSPVESPSSSTQTSPKAG